MLVPNLPKISQRLGDRRGGKFYINSIQTNFSPSGEDKLLLMDVREEGFSVKLMYKGLDPSPAIEFPYCSVWNPVVPPKIGFFAWEAA